MTALLYPYPTLLGDVGLTLESAELDGLTIPMERINKIDRQLSVYALGKSKWDELTLRVSVTLPAGELNVFDAAGKQIGILIKLTCNPTSARQSVILSRRREGIWSGTMLVSAAAYDGRAKLEAIVTVDDPDRHVIGTSDPWYIEFLETQRVDSLYDRLIDCNFESFKDAEHQYLRDCKEQAIYVDLHQMRPTLWINDDIPGLKELLKRSIGRGGSASAASEMPANEISAKMWTALFNAAVASLEESSDDEDIPPLPDGWPGHVLSRTLPELYPGFSSDEARRYARNEFRGDGNSGMRDLQSRVVPVVDRIVASTITLRNLLKLSMKTEESDVD